MNKEEGEGRCWGATSHRYHTSDSATVLLPTRRAVNPSGFTHTGRPYRPTQIGTTVPQNDSTLVSNYTQYFSKAKAGAINTLVHTSFGAGAPVSEVDFPQSGILSESGMSVALDRHGTMTPKVNSLK